MLGHTTKVVEECLKAYICVNHHSMQFLKNLLTSVLGTLIAFGLFFVLFLIIIAGASASLGAEEAVVVKENSVLQLNIDKPVLDRSPTEFEFGAALGMEAESLGLDKILASIRKATDDDRIMGISIEHTFLQSGMSQTQAIRKELNNFRESGKFIYAYHDVYTQKDYYLASVADSVFVHPEGGIDFRGLSAEVLYYKSLQEKSGVQMEVIRHGAYKSAVEPFLSDRMSEENRLQIGSLLNSIWDEISKGVADRSQLDIENVNTIATSVQGSNPEKALQVGLIDGMLLRRGYEALLKSKLGLEEDDKLNTIKLTDYQKTTSTSLGKGSDRIAVVYAQGEIIYGEGSEQVIGQELMIKTLKKLKKNDRVKGVVLRIDSPGGSALSSELIWQEIEQLNMDKPVVVSMGDVAASGGYYIACGADAIFAEPNTITGSIGVFGVLPNVSKLANRWGISAEQVTTHPNAQLYSPMEPLSDSARSEITEQIERIYDTFLDRVAQGRGMSVEEVDAVAQGRVWSGTEALEIGLVDSLGGLEDAVLHVAELAGTETYKTVDYPKFEDDFESFLESLQRGPFGFEFMGYSINDFEALLPKNISVQERIQARLPFALEIR